MANAKAFRIEGEIYDAYVAAVLRCDIPAQLRFLLSISGHSHAGNIKKCWLVASLAYTDPF